jgi:twitching motility protein PilT
MEIEELLKLSVAAHASDLHLLPGLPPLLRIDGELIEMKDQPPLSQSDTEQLIFSIMSEEQLHTFQNNLVLDMALNYPEMGNFRVSALHQLHGIAAVFRVIPHKIPSFDELGLPSVFKRLLTLSHGLILVTGPTGSGKSTTLATMVDHINMTRACHIITIEDPIEFIYQSKKSAINQMQVGRDTPDFATALRASLRQDPDVILLGEMRDLETIRLALTAAETGHLVMTTLHAGTAPLAISRAVDIFPVAEKARVRNLISETLQAVICQTLVKSLAGGRVAAFEIMLATPAIRHLINQDMIPQMETTIQTNGDIGMCTMDQYLQKLAAKRLITSVTARGISIDREAFRYSMESKKGFGHKGKK